MNGTPPSTPGILLDEQQYQQRLKRARPQLWRKLCEVLAILVAVGCLLGDIHHVNTKVDEAAQAHESPVHYVGKWMPEKQVYHPDEDATFRFIRIALFPGKELYVTNDCSFENNETGVSYPGGHSVRALREKDRGRQAGLVVRTIPQTAKPGKNYTFEGLVRSETAYRTLPVGFQSEPFEVRAWGSEQEKAAAAWRLKQRQNAIQTAGSKLDASREYVSE